MSEKPNVVVTLLSACLAVPMATLSIAKELRKVLLQIHKNEMPVCRDCRFWDKNQSFCHCSMGHFEAYEYCSKWEEAQWPYV